MFNDNEVLDIRFYGDKVYLLKKQKWTTKHVINQLSRYSYSGINRIRDRVVENTKLPPILLTFYSFIFDKFVIPTEEELFNEYINSFFNHEDHYAYLKSQYRAGGKVLLNLEGLRARVLRTYPSLIRDFHFFLMCQESGAFDKVIYSLYNDYYRGLDLKVVYNGQPYFVSLYTKTPRGSSFKSKKYNRHNYDNIKEIHLEIDLLKSTNRVGDFILYDDSHLRKLINEITHQKIVI